MTKYIYLFYFSLSYLTFSNPTAVYAELPFKLQRVLSHQFERPIDMVFSRIPVDKANKSPLEGSFVAEQGGRIYRIVDGQSVLLVDFSDQVYTRHNEEGLLGLALYETSKTTRLFVYFSASRPRRSVVAELSLIPNTSRVAYQVASLKTLLEIKQPYGNHNGGGLAIDSKGLLYIGVGDGGSGGDPHNHAQNLQSYLGKILRIDVSESGQIKIPQDNPFVNTPNAKPEIWAYGLRNPWRISLDLEGKGLWVGDVGQDRTEEVDLVHGGDNMGWKWREGDHDYQDRYALSFKKVNARQRAKWVEPISTYSHREGTSITGGHVYRAQVSSPWYGHYFYADFVTGVIWSVDADAIYSQKAASAHRLGQVQINIASFARDPQGKLYALGFDGHIYALKMSE